MNLAEIFPKNGRQQRNYCDSCKQHLDLVFKDFEEEISGIEIKISGLPVLRCPFCGIDHLPDLSRFAIIESHKRASEQGLNAFTSNRVKIQKNFGFTTVLFLYDPDDYFYIPGLLRPFDEGFLTPVFFKRRVLLKYDNTPGYRVRFSSTTYGEIDTGDNYISFGINKNELVVMWLGDIAKLPESEQFYLRSENVPSDHSIGSEFYDGQIECVFTEPSKETLLFRRRSEFVEACFKRFGKKIAHLDEEAIDLAFKFNPPINDTAKERRHVADTLNKIYIESLDSSALGEILSANGVDPKNLGSIKRLQRLLEIIAPGKDVAAILCPLYVLYDFRVAYSHLTSAKTAKDIFEKITNRLGIEADASLTTIYNRIQAELTALFENMAELIKAS